MEVSSFFFFPPPSVITNNNIIPLIPPRGAGVHTETGSAALLPPLITRTIWALGKTNSGAGTAPPKKTPWCPQVPTPAPPNQTLSHHQPQGTGS